MEYLCTIKDRMEDRIANTSVLRTREDLNKVIVDTTNINTVTVSKDFIEAYFPYNSLTEYIRNVHALNPNLKFITEDYVTEQDVDKKKLKMLKDNLNTEDLSLLLQFKSYDMIETITMLIDYYENNKSYELEFSSVNSSLRETIDKLNIDLKEANKQIEQEQFNKLDVQERLQVLVDRIRYTHGKDINEKMLFKADTNRYDKVLYIKEITRVQYMDSFVDALKETLSILYDMPTRYIVIEGYQADGKVSLYPKHKPHFKVNERDVTSGDVIMLGFQPKLFADIMRNTSGVSILIIFDRAGYKTPHLVGPNVEYIYTASDSNDVDEKIPRSRIVSYKEDTMYIPHITDFNTLAPKDKVAKYSSIPIMKKIIKLLEG